MGLKGLFMPTTHKVKFKHLVELSYKRFITFLCTLACIIGKNNDFLLLTLYEIEHLIWRVYFNSKN